MKLEGFLIRPVRYEDLDEVIEINLKTLPENYSRFFYEELYKRFPKTFLVAEVEGRIGGYVMCRIERCLSKFSKLRFVKSCHVVSIAVLEEYRRRGIATAMLKEALRNSMTEYGATEGFLEVRVTNIPAINLYRKLGFRIVDRIRGYYLDGEDAYIMAMPLNQTGV